MPEVATPTWVQQVLDEHEALRQKKTHLREYAQQPRPEAGEAGAHSWAAKLARLMVEIHDELFRHFRFEEEGGMAEEIKARHPRANASVDRLMAEHAEMLREVRYLMDEALLYSEGRAPENPWLRRRVTVLLDRLELHEAEETGLIQGLELLDLGRGD